MRRYLRDPMLSRFDTIPECDGHTHTHTDRHTTTAYTALSKASRGKNSRVNATKSVAVLTNIEISGPKWYIGEDMNDRLLGKFSFAEDGYKQKYIQSINPYVAIGGNFF